MLTPCLSSCSNHRLRIRAQRSASKPSFLPSPPPPVTGMFALTVTPLTAHFTAESVGVRYEFECPPVLHAIECITNDNHHSTTAAVVAVVAAVHMLPPLRACLLSSPRSSMIRTSFLPITNTLPIVRPMFRHAETALPKLMPMWPRLLQKRRRQRPPRNRRQCAS